MKIIQDQQKLYTHLIQYYTNLMNISRDSDENPGSKESIFQDFTGPPTPNKIQQIREGGFYTIQAPTMNTKQYQPYTTNPLYSIRNVSEPVDRQEMIKNNSSVHIRGNKIRTSLMNYIMEKSGQSSKEPINTQHNQHVQNSMDGDNSALNLVHHKTLKFADDASDFITYKQQIGQIDQRDSDQTTKNKRTPNLFKLVMAKLYFNNFIENLLQKSYVKNYTHFSDFQNELMDDLNYQINKQSNSKQQCQNISKYLKIIFELNRCFKFLGLNKILEPNGKLIIIWRIIHILTILVIFFWLPFKLSFDLYSDKTMTIQFLEYILLYVIGFDILLTLNIAYIEKGFIIRSRKQILINYIKTQASVDIISFAILFLTFAIIENRINTSWWYLSPSFIYYFFSTQKLKSSIIILENYFHVNDVLQDLIGLIKLLLTIVLIAHLFSCLWHGVAYYQLGQTKTWLDNKGISDADIFLKYLYSFYWAAMTMTTVGYGDVTPQNSLELITCNVTMFVSCGVFAFSINSIGIMLQNLNSRNTEYKKNINILNRFLTKNSVKMDLQIRIRSYFDYIWDEEMEMNDEEIQSVLDRLSGHLQEEIKYELRECILKSSQALSKFSDKVLRQLSFVMEEIRFSPDQFILMVIIPYFDFKQNIEDDCSLYLITRGIINIKFQDLRELEEDQVSNEKNLSSLTVGQSFGDYSFFSGQLRSASAQSNGFSKAYRIKRTDFLQILNQHPLDKELFGFIKDSIQIYQNFGVINFKCYSCLKNTHLIKDCPAVHFVASRERILKQNQFPYIQDRNKTYIRKATQYHHFSPLIEMMFMNHQIKDFQNNLNDNNDHNATIEEALSHLSAMDDEDQMNGTFNEQSYQEFNQKSVDQNSKQQLQQNSSFTENNQEQKLCEISDSSESKISLDEIKQNPRRNNFKQTQLTQTTAGFGAFYKSIEPNSASLPHSNHYKQYPSPTPPNQIDADSPSKYIQKDDQKEATNKSNTSIHKNKPTTKKGLSVHLNPNNNENKRISSHLTIEGTYNKKSYRTIRSTKTKTTFKQEQSSYNPINAHLGSVMQIGDELQDFDKMNLYKTYFPFNNFDYVIKRLGRIMRLFQGKRRVQNEFSLYTFSHYAMKKAMKMRKGLAMQKSQIDENYQKQFEGSPPPSSNLRGRKLKHIEETKQFLPRTTTSNMPGQRQLQKSLDKHQTIDED